MSYRPRVSPEYAEQIRRWHERSYELARAEGGDGQDFEYLGLKLHVPPDVQPITRMAHLLGQAVLDEVRERDRVLDMGTGSGVNAILAAATAARVLAVDISPAAVAAARANAVANGVDVEVRESDVFSAVDGEFDLIVFDPHSAGSPPAARSRRPRPTRTTPRSLASSRGSTTTSLPAAACCCSSGPPATSRTSASSPRASTPRCSRPSASPVTAGTSTTSRFG